MRYRIVEKQLKNGTVEFRGEVRKGFFWKPINMDGSISFWFYDCWRDSRVYAEEAIEKHKAGGPKKKKKIYHYDIL